MGAFTAWSPLTSTVWHHIAWDEASGGMMGAGGASLATFANHRATDRHRCGLLRFVVDGLRRTSHSCVETPAPGAGVTGESSNLQQYDESLTSYYSGSHWWLSSASSCNPATAVLVAWLRTIRRIRRSHSGWNPCCIRSTYSLRLGK